MVLLVEDVKILFLLFDPVDVGSELTWSGVAMALQIAGGTHAEAVKGAVFPIRAIVLALAAGFGVI